MSVFLKELREGQKVKATGKEGIVMEIAGDLIKVKFEDGSYGMIDRGQVEEVMEETTLKQTEDEEIEIECPNCQGTGTIDDEGTECPKCRGTGSIAKSIKKGKIIPKGRECPKCKTHNVDEDGFCHYCGEYTVEEKKSLKKTTWTEIHDALVREGYSEDRASRIANWQMQRLGKDIECPFCKNKEVLEVSKETPIDKSEIEYQCMKCSNRFSIDKQTEFEFKSRIYCSNCGLKTAKHIANGLYKCEKCNNQFRM
jgi:DNA-directed RNA polymerase subunit RPC12/RpoP